MKLQNLIHILIGTVCIGLLARAHVVVPEPGKGYRGGNTVEGRRFQSTTINEWPLLKQFELKTREVVGRFQ